jgi:parallel beta-helix repeat protein
MRNGLLLSVLLAATAVLAQQQPPSHRIAVTTNADSGSGSLREAFHTANAICATTVEVCEIVFRIPNATARWVTIYPETPLPHLIGRYVTIDGSTQTSFTGDTNPLGPELEVSGVMEPEGDGIVYTGCGGFRLDTMTINGFPGSGVLLASSCTFTGTISEVTSSYIGTDPTGTRAIRNQRGVYVDGSASASIRNNVISGNMRSGVYVQRGGAYVGLNKIGLTPGLTGLGNGATGVYVGPDNSARIEHNYIGFNHHWGIAIHPDADFVHAAPNSLQANFSLGIDWGYDTDPINSRVPAPEITSVRVVDGKTIIEGNIPDPGGPTEHGVHLYANDAPDASGYGEGQYTLGLVRVTGPRFTYVHPEDLRGKWVTATFTQVFNLGFARGPRADGITTSLPTSTSEFSRAVLVQ